MIMRSMENYKAENLTFCWADITNVLLIITSGMTLSLMFNVRAVITLVVGWKFFYIFKI